MFWNVRATRACWATRKSGMRSSRKRTPAGRSQPAHAAGGEEVEIVPRIGIAVD